MRYRNTKTGVVICINDKIKNTELWEVVEASPVSVSDTDEKPKPKRTRKNG